MREEIQNSMHEMKRRLTKKTLYQQKKTKTKIPPCIWCLGVFYKLVNYILFKGCLLGRFSTSRTASFCFSSTYIARYVHT